MKETIAKINEVIAALQADLAKAAEGNKAAAARARKATLELEKLGNAFRKQSIADLDSVWKQQQRFSRLCASQASLCLPEKWPPFPDLTGRRWIRLSPSSRRTAPSYHLSAASGSRQSKIGFIEDRRGGHWWSPLLLWVFSPIC